MFYFLSVSAIVVCTFVYMDFYMVELSRAEHSHSPTEAHFSCNIVLMHSALVLYHHLFCKPAMPHFSMVIPENNSCIWISRMPDLIIPFLFTTTQLQQCHGALGLYYMVVLND